MTHQINEGQLKITFFNHNYRNSAAKSKFKYILLKASEPHSIIQTLTGEIAVGETTSYTISQLEAGNYCLIGLKLADPRPGNPRVHQLMIYSGRETVYDVSHIYSANYMDQYI